MADAKISALSALTAGQIADGDLLVGVDISDTTMDAAGSDKKFTALVLSNYVTLNGDSLVAQRIFVR